MPPPPSLIAALDVDGDGLLSRKEVRRAADAIERMDEDRDDGVTMAELRMPPPAKKHGEEKKPDKRRPPRPPVIATLDADRDGTISAGEWEKPPSRSRSSIKMDTEHFRRRSSIPKGRLQNLLRATFQRSDHPLLKCAIPLRSGHRSGISHGSQKPWILSISRRFRLVGRPFEASRLAACHVRSASSASGEVSSS